MLPGATRRSPGRRSAATIGRVNTQAHEAQWIEALAARGAPRRFRARQLLIQEGETGDTLYVIRSGRLRVFCSNAQGREVTLGIYGPGDYVGEMALDGGPRSANVEAMEASVCCVVTRQALLDYIATQPEFALVMMSRLIRRARLATESARSLALIDVYGRLTALLNGLAQAQPDGTRRIDERLTHQEIASRIACSREMVSRLMKGLEVGGYVQMREKRVVLAKKLPHRW